MLAFDGSEASRRSMYVKEIQCFGGGGIGCYPVDWTAAPHARWWVV